ncbi:hypothetical protein OG534_36780 [Streptomyces sp. NBC_01294]|nr:hypothetical protein OG534_36780 [Streptomyces sp. NBC_01294]
MLDTGRLDSVYATVRTVSAGPQRVVARNGFRPLGILPNAVDLSTRESLALYARHSTGVLDRRIPVTAPALLVLLLRTAESALGIGWPWGPRRRPGACSRRPLRTGPSNGWR